MKKTLILFVLSLFTNFAIAQNTILWSVKKPNSDKTSYILGTFHQMGNSFIDERPIIKKIISESDLAIFESIEDRKQKITDVMLNRDDDFTYKTVLEKEDLDLLSNLTDDWEVPVSKHKPAELLIRIEQKYYRENCGTIKSTDTSEHMDDYLLSFANKQNIETLGLETFADQMYVINNPSGEELSWEKAKDILPKLLFNFKNNKYKKQLCRIAKNYMNMKFNYEFSVQCTDNNEVLTKRNEKWMPIIEQSIENNNSVFIAVGLFHLYLDCGIISQLRKNGYQVNPVKLK